MENELRQAIQQAMLQDKQTSSDRVERVLQRARRQVGLRDFLSLFLVRIWIVLLSLGSVVYALCNRPNKKTPLIPAPGDWPGFKDKKPIKKGG